jgi:DNA-binding transcriptional regulator GbsR (MarR family)
VRPTRAEVLAAVLASTGGLTTREIAAQLGCPMSQVSTTVSKLAAYFLIDREPIPGNRQSFRWKRKAV